MKKKYFISTLILIYMIIIISPPETALGESINFHSICSSGKKVTKYSTMLLPETEFDRKHIEVQLEAPVKNVANFETLDGQRLIIETYTDRYSLQNNKVIIFPDAKIYAENSSALPLKIYCTVHPEDSPGNYRNNLLVTETYTDGQKKTWLIPLQVEVKPWLKLEVTHNSHSIDRLSENQNTLTSSFPGTLKITGNSPWKLYASGENIPQMLYIDIPSEPRKHLINGKQEELLAAGETPTAKKRGYISLPFVLTLDNYQEMRAGKINFPLSFHLQLNDT